VPGRGTKPRAASVVAMSVTAAPFAETAAACDTFDEPRRCARGGSGELHGVFQPCGIAGQRARKLRAQQSRTPALELGAQ
jgi:hypothetical protein